MHWQRAQKTDRYGTAVRFLIICLIITTALNVLLPALISVPPEDTHAVFTERVRSDFSYDREDYPREFPLPSHAYGPVALTVEDSINFQLDTPEGAAQWRAIFPPGDGYVELGPDKRRFRLSMFHALDCLGTIRENILYRKEHRDIPASPEAQFCLSYIRQMIQCRADTQLEQVRSEYGGKSVQPFVTHNDCRDWSAVYEELEKFHLM